MRRQVFVRWFIFLTVLWVVANWPTTFGKSGFYQEAGFPIPFAWGIGHFQEFDPAALAVDVALGGFVIVGVSCLCAWSREKTGE